MKTKQKGSSGLFIIISVFLVLLIVGGYLYYQSNIVSKKQLNLPESSNVTEETSSTSVAVKVASSTVNNSSVSLNLKTYKNTKYGFEVKYSSDSDLSYTYKDYQEAIPVFCWVGTVVDTNGKDLGLQRNCFKQDSPTNYEPVTKEEFWDKAQYAHEVNLGTMLIDASITLKDQAVFPPKEGYRAGQDLVDSSIESKKRIINGIEVTERTAAFPGMTRHSAMFVKPITGNLVYMVVISQDIDAGESQDEILKLNKEFENTISTFVFKSPVSQCKNGAFNYPHCNADQPSVGY